MAEEVHALHVETGRFFLPGEFLAGDTVTVVDHALAVALSPENPQALVGQRLTVGNRQMRVVGIVSDQTVQLLSACEGTAYMPLTTFLDTFGGQVQELTLSIPKGLQADAVAETALGALSAAGGDFDAMSLAEEIDAAKAVIRIFVMVLACVAAVCMFTGGIGVMNILLVSVRERRREIGVMKAVGGTSAQVGLLFLLEAASYAVLGGILGVALGGIMVRVFGGWIGLQTALTLETVLPTLAGATVLGLIFGVAPAPACGTNGARGGLTAGIIPALFRVARSSPWRESALRYCKGGMPTWRRKIRLKCDRELNPVRLAISATCAGWMPADNGRAANVPPLNTPPACKPVTSLKARER